MRAMRIVGATNFPGAPAGWDEKRDGPCGLLPVRVAPRLSGNSPLNCESAWKPTPDELQLLNDGGVVILHVVGWQVPVSLRVEPAESATTWDGTAV